MHCNQPKSDNTKLGSEAWSNGSVRASGAVGPEFEPTFCHSLLSGGPWQDLVSSVRLEPLTVYDVPVAPKKMISSKSASVPLRNQGRAMSGVRAQQRSPGNHPKCRHQQKSLSPPER